MRRRIVMDLETNGDLEHTTKIHCMCWHDVDTKEEGDITDYREMRLLLDNTEAIIGHSIVDFDFSVVDKILGISLRGRQIIDTLGLSYALYPKRLKHGLESWGNDFGIIKPKVEDWVRGEIELYLHRCREDRRINTKLWEYMWEYLMKIYNGVEADIYRYIAYLGFKLDCIREQGEVKIKVDKVKAEENLIFLTEKAKIKKDILRVAMPKMNIYDIKERPKIMYKKDNSLSKLGEAWLEFLRGQGLPEYHNMAVKIIKETLEGNPTSHPQLKAWLFSLGWIPKTYKYVKRKGAPKGEKARRVPQISNDDSSDICESVKELYQKEPKLRELEGLFKINHRIGLLNGFLECSDDNGFIKSEIGGFTNTLRVQHKKPIANLPTIPKLYWEKVRECLIAPDDNHVLCGSDMSGLEDQTARHYMFKYDPDYVRDLMKPGYDPHLDIAERAGLLTAEQIKFFKEFDRTKIHPDNIIEVMARYSKIKGIRLQAKKTNFAAKYGAYPPKIAITAGITEELAQVFFDTYWERNWAIKKVAEDAYWKTIDGQMWLYNPVSGFYYTLRDEKDIFSTLNQGTGVYCFDIWIREVRVTHAIRICLQYHDEHVAPVFKGDEETHKQALLIAAETANEILKLNVKLGISVDFGHSYADIH